MVLITFDRICEIRDMIESNIVFEIEEDDHTYELQFFNVMLTDRQSLVTWVNNNSNLIENQKCLNVIDYMLDENYFDQRFKDKYDFVYLVRNKSQAIISTNKVVHSKQISCENFETYKKDIANVIFN